MKLNIAICDDERAEIDYLMQLAGQWAGSRGIAAAFTCYESAESFLFHYEERPNAELVLLDVQMGRLSGIELAKRIRRDNDSMQIIFITGYPDFMGEGYEVSALHYLMKPVKAEKLFEVLDRAQARLQTVPRTLLLPRAGGSIRMKADDIVYAEVLSHTTTLYLTTGTEDFQMRLSDMEKALGEGFIRCHRSYLVSIRHVRRVTRTAVVLENGRELPLSRDLYDAVNQAFIQFNWR